MKNTSILVSAACMMRNVGISTSAHRPYKNVMGSLDASAYLHEGQLRSWQPLLELCVILAEICPRHCPQLQVSCVLAAQNDPP